MSDSDGPGTLASADRLEAQLARELTPTTELRTRLKEAREALVALATRKAQEGGIPLRTAMVCGSVARETYLPGNHDMDLFLLFDPALPAPELERQGLALAFRILDSPEKRYAQHPYLRGRFQGFAVDAVPGYRVERGDRPLTAVDRTPFHQEYLAARLDERLRSEIRLLKRFLRGIGVYGAETRTEGFSGYLQELLVLRHGGFRPLLQEASRWRIPQRLAPEGPEPSVQEDAALVLADPVDPHRNVSSAVSRRSLATFILASAEYLKAPAREFFYPPSRPPPTPEDRQRELSRRGSAVAGLSFPTPELVDDILYPQLRKAQRALAASLQRVGFGVLGTASAKGDDHCIILVETTTVQVSPVHVQEGPPVGLEHAHRFLEKWSGTGPPILQGPYITPEGRLQVEVPRTLRDLPDVIRSELPQLSVGRDLRDPVLRHGKVLDWEAIRTDAVASVALQELWGKSLPWRPLSPPGPPGNSDVEEDGPETQPQE